MSNVSQHKRKGKSTPSKPYADFPLFAHQNGQWAKKIRRKLHYFGPWDNPDQALQTYLQALKKPSRRAIEASRRCQGERMCEALQIRVMMAAGWMPLKAMILLGINCGFGNYDCGSLPKRAVDLERGWIKFPRPKTGLPRRCPLWPETIKALAAAIEQRPAARDEADGE